MGLYLCIFDGDEELEGIEVGAYSDYNALRDYVVCELEDGRAGSRFPVFVLHSDCDGEWTTADCEKLRLELTDIAAEMKKRPMINFNSVWQKAVAASIGLMPQNAFESFIDVDGEFLIERLKNMVEVALKRHLPILFQ